MLRAIIFIAAGAFALSWGLWEIERRYGESAATWGVLAAVLSSLAALHAIRRLHARIDDLRRRIGR